MSNSIFLVTPKKIEEDSCPIQILDDYPSIMERLRSSFNENKTKPLNYRLSQLGAFLRMITECEQEYADAMMKDLRKSKFEVLTTELDIVRNEIVCFQQCLRQWAKPESGEKNVATMMDSVLVQPEPYGVVLVIGAWNYPLKLTLAPMVGAIGSGNCVILKPSELCPNVATVLENSIHRYLDQNTCMVVNGGIEETTELLKERFDYIFYTGGPGVGRIIRQASNKYLTPVALELGGKSPVFLDEEVDMMVATRRLLWGKFLSGGQTCVAPDYVLCTEKTQERFLEAARKVLVEFFPDNPQESLSYARIVNERHFQRLVGYLTSGKVAIGGRMDKSDLYLDPTIMINVSPNSPIMQEEIFGPILPVTLVKSPQDAVDFINRREKPLALYVLSTRKDIISLFQKYTSSGTFCANDTIIQLSVDSLPFGGVGNSGMGCYHGKYSFDCFSHKKAVLIRDYNPLGEVLGRARYPPYSENNMKIVRFLLKKRSSIFPHGTRYVMVFLFGFLTAALIWLTVDQTTKSKA